MIDDCSPGTSHFVVVAAVNAARGLVARSQQYTVQTSAPVTQPALQLRCVCPIAVIFFFLNSMFVLTFKDGLLYLFYALYYFLCE